MGQDIILPFLLNVFVLLLGVALFISDYFSNAFSSLIKGLGGPGIFYIIVLLNGILWGIGRVAHHLERIADVANNYEEKTRGY